MTVRNPLKLTWKERLAKDERDDDARGIDELDGWVENTLKSSNPNYQDPDTFFERMESAQVNANQKGGAKDVGKGKKK